MKKLSFFIIILRVLIIAFCILLIRDNYKSKDDLLESSLKIGSIVSDFYKGKDNLNDLINYNTVSGKVISQLNDYNKKLKQLDKAEFNLTLHFNTVYKDEKVEYSEGTPVVDDYNENNIETSLSNEKIENDKNIYTKNGLDFIKVSDIKIIDNSYGILAYKNKWMVIPLEQIPLTYDRLIKNVSYKYKLNTYKNNKDKHNYIELSYISKQDSSKKLLIKVYYYKKKIVDIDIKDNLWVVRRNN
ncbi:TPA: hypothetical protein KNT04_002566 [Clostridioides difficile]|nr:hypothetical protein [Clostridioides difficile]